jgi:hypothetical protein
VYAAVPSAILMRKKILLVIFFTNRCESHYWSSLEEITAVTGLKKGSHPISGTPETKGGGPLSWLTGGWYNIPSKKATLSKIPGWSGR